MNFQLEELGVFLGYLGLFSGNIFLLLICLDYALFSGLSDSFWYLLLDLCQVGRWER